MTPIQHTPEVDEASAQPAIDSVSRESVAEAQRKATAMGEKPVEAVRNIGHSEQNSNGRDVGVYDGLERSQVEAREGVLPRQRNENISKYKFNDIDSDDESDESDEDVIGNNLTEFSERVERIRALAASLDKVLGVRHHPALPNPVEYPHSNVLRRLKRIE